MAVDPDIAQLYNRIAAQCPDAKAFVFLWDGDGADGIRWAAKWNGIAYTFSTRDDAMRALDMICTCMMGQLHIPMAFGNAADNDEDNEG